MQTNKEVSRQVINAITPYGVTALLALPSEVFEAARWAVCGSTVVDMDAEYPNNVIREVITNL
jgi:hypothetical protein